LLTPKRGVQVLQFQCGFRKFTSHLRHISQSPVDKDLSFNYFMADEPVSRILYDANSFEPCAATIIPLAPASRPGSSDLPEGPSFDAACAAPEGAHSLSRANSVSRASSPLLFGLAPRGVCRASDIAARAVGSYPTFSPLPAPRSIRRCPEGLPPGYHRDTLRRRYILCGTFREQ
jgi:hypothetical protein